MDRSGLSHEHHVTGPRQFQSGGAPSGHPPLSWVAMRVHLALITLLISSALPAQFDNPEQKIQEIVDEVAKQMQEIDELLLKAPESLRSATSSCGRRLSPVRSRRSFRRCGPTSSSSLKRLR